MGSGILIMIKFLLLFLLPIVAHAQFANTAFFQLRTKQLTFTTTAQTVFQGNCSGIVTVQSRNGSGAAQNVTSTTTVTISASATTSYFSDAYCRSPIATFSIPSGQNSVSFYFVTSTVSTNTLTASATGFKTGTQDETIQVNPYVWVGLGGDANWTTVANWQGGAAPTSTQVAVFNSTCTSNCSPTINSSISVRGIRMDSDYSGTITQGAGASITIGSAAFLQYGGNFTGANADIVLNGSPLIVNAGTFTSTSTSLKFVDARGGYSSFDTFVVTNPSSFIHNNGLVWFHVRSNNNPIHLVKLAANNPMYDFRMRDDSGGADDAIVNFTSSPSRPIVQGSMTLVHGGLRGPVELQGNLTFAATYGSYLGPDNLALTFTGSANQIIDNSAGSATPTGNIVVNKGATSKISFIGNYTLIPAGQSVTLTSGRLDLGSTTLTIAGNTLSMASGTEIYLNTGILKVNGSSIPAGPYSSGAIISGAAP
jgi:hypothetical protein